MNATNVALPKTYHHFESSGAICFIGESRTLIPSRSSSQFQIVLNNLITAWWKSERSPVSFALRHLLSALRSGIARSEEHTSELQSRENLVCRLLLEKKK